MKREYCFFMLCLAACLLINSCASNESAIATAIAETNAVEELEKAATQLAEIQQTETSIPAEVMQESESQPDVVDASEGADQVLAAAVCPGGQELLYYEDFEDEKAQGWYNVEDTEFRYEHIEERGKVLSMQMQEGNADIFYLEDFANAVWLIDVRAGNPPLNYSLNWHYQNNRENRTKHLYYTNFAPGDYLQIHIVAPDLHEAQSGLVESAEPLPARDPGDWQRYAFSYFDGQVDLWLDGEFIAGAQHADPIEYGGFGIRFGDYPDTISIDNVAVCSLEVPYSP